MDHLRICSQTDIETGSTLFDDVHLVHCALPECDMDAIDLSVEFLGKRLSSPLFIAAMTGGHPDTAEVNRVLASAAERYGLGIGVGSQRAALEKPELADSFAIVRETAPHAFVCGNLGAVQLVEHGTEWAERAVEMIDADALCIHLNFLQEAIQPEGDHSAVGCLDAIRQLCKDVKFPARAEVADRLRDTQTDVTCGGLSVERKDFRLVVALPCESPGLRPRLFVHAVSDVAVQQRSVACVVTRHVLQLVQLVD